ncbi:iron-containing redox enzyme family protein [Geodermatophilus sp. SYSU D01180]
MRLKIDLAMPALRAAADRFLDHPHPDVAYREYLVTSHAVARASLPLMEAALAEAQRTAHDDPVCARLLDYLPRHILEETDHDSWILEDLDLLEVDRRSVTARPPSHRVAAMVGAQYYWIHHFHPAALLGYMAVLEGVPPSPVDVDDLIHRTGFHPKAFRTLMEHAVADERHGEEVFALIDEMELNAGLSRLVGMSAMHTVEAMAAAIDEVFDRSVALPR